MHTFIRAVILKLHLTQRISLKHFKYFKCFLIVNGEFLIVFPIKLYEEVYFSRRFLPRHFILWYQIKPNISRCWQCSNINHKPTKNVVIVWTRIMIPNSYINSLSVSTIGFLLTNLSTENN